MRLAERGLQISGIGQAGGSRIEGAFEGEFQALNGWLPAPWNNFSGTWGTQFAGKSDSQGIQFAAKAESVDFSPGKGEAIRDLQPSASIRVSTPPDFTKVDLEELVVSCRLATLEARGRLNEPNGRRRLELEGKFSPVWERVNAFIVQAVEPGAHLTGQSRPFRLQGDLLSLADSINGEIGVNLDSADIYGLRFEKTPLVLRFTEGKPTIDPIEVMVNEGLAHLEPVLKVDSKGATIVSLGHESTLTDVRMNDEVSRRVLSFVAPVLDRATRVQGKVSASIDEAIIPIGGTTGMTVEGSVIFQDVEFMPGPFLDPVLGLVGRNDRALLRLNEPVELSIADRRVYQSGLALPFGKVTTIGLEGWVDFDKNLSLVASVPIVPPGLADRPLLNDIAGGAKVRVRNLWVWEGK